MEKTYQEMYEEAANFINENGGYYKGYVGANGMSLYVDDKYGVNAVASNRAHEALCIAMSLIEQ